MKNTDSCPLCQVGGIELVGLDGARLLAAFQVLQFPSGFYSGARHSDAIRTIGEITGVVPVGKPKDVRPGGGLQAYFEWLCSNHRFSGEKKRHPGWG